jgi:hypothetical protein
MFNIITSIVRYLISNRCSHCNQSNVRHLGNCIHCDSHVCDSCGHGVAIRSIEHYNVWCYKKKKDSTNIHVESNTAVNI